MSSIAKECISTSASCISHKDIKVLRNLQNVGYHDLLGFTHVHLLPGFYPVGRGAGGRGAGEECRGRGAGGGVQGGGVQGGSLPPLLV